MIFWWLLFFASSWQQSHPFTNFISGVIHCLIHIIFGRLFLCLEMGCFQAYLNHHGNSLCLLCTGHEGYLVGGAVRDMLLGARPKDFDILTTATPVQVGNLTPIVREV